MEQSKTSLRVKVRKEYLPFYKDVIKKHLFARHSEFFTLCANIGYKYGKVDEAYRGIELCQAYTFTPYQRTVLQTLIYKDKKKIVDEVTMFEEAEQYADAGFRYLVQHVIADVVTQVNDGEYTLSLGEEQELQLLLAEFVQKEMASVPF
ncbi:hypothetical protein [Metabacillus iocasae]|uniref:Uncharacterized protein n=1 Tax=Priestia iocasae TaxID=2291674 RepID=A0ABS2QVV3_9BACI|nr:hypothetical protein [Metabacillus iocasae]MBM7703547.1 hypothetical protein [Metabacillus iocasae]